MMQRINIKTLVLLGVGITVLSMVVWWNQSNELRGAEPETTSQSEMASKEKVTRAATSLNRAITVVVNERGLQAAPKGLVIALNGAFPIAGTSQTELAKLVTGLAIPAPSTGITWEYVDAEGTPTGKPSSAIEGLQTIYVKITEKTGSSSIQVAVPVSVTSTNVTSLLSGQAIVKADRQIVLYPDETKDKTNEELQALIQSKANLSAWDMTSGEALPVSVTATTAVNNTVGSYTVMFTVNLNGTTATTTRTVTIFGATLRATYFSKAQNTTSNMGTNGATYLLKYQTTAAATATGATYEWVADKSGTPTVPADTFDTSQTGFKWGYIKMTDTAKPTVSTIIAVPITVTSDNVTLVDGKLAYKIPRTLDMLKKSEVISGTTQELAASLKDSLKLVAWDVTNGADLAISVTDLGGLTAGSKAGKYDLIFSAELADNIVKTPKRSFTLLPDSIASDAMYGWQTLSRGGKQGVIVNPINNSKIEFKRRGPNLATDPNLKEQGFLVTGGSGLIFDYYANDYVYEAGKGVYAPRTDNLLPLGIGTGDTDSLFVSQFYLKKGNVLKQILVDSVNQLVYVYDISLSKNLNFFVTLSMYNTDVTTRSLGLLKKAYTAPSTNNWRTSSLANNSGFTVKNTTDNFTIKLKSSSGQYLSDFTMSTTGFTTTGNSSSYPNASYRLGSYNWFKDDFSRLGMEQYNYLPNTLISASIGTESAYQLGAPSRQIASEEALKGGYEVFAGTELPYMRLTSNPEEWHIYPDYQGGDFITDYTLASIPSINGTGTIYVKYPNEETLDIPFLADQNLAFNGRLTIPRSTLPATLNDQSGTIKRYATSMLGVHETEGAMKDLPSNDYAVSVNVYNIGGTPIAQTVKKDAVWSKTAADLIKDPVILPGNTAVYEYVEGQPDTSKLGLQIVKVRMTDKEQPTQTTVIEVPVNVIAGTPPTTGLTVVANDFTLSKGKVKGLSPEAINELILKESKAKAWDNATGLATDVTLAVKSTTLGATPTETTYKATIQGTKEGLTAETTITITIGEDLTAQAVTQSIPLGTDESYWQATTLKETVKEVTGSDTITDYTVTLVTPPITNRITTDSSMKVKVASTDDPSQSVDVEVPVKVTWGNSIAFGGSGTTLKSGQSTLALTLHEESKDQPYLSSTYGNLPKADDTIALSTGSEPFYQVTLIPMNGQGTGQEKAKEVTDGPNPVGEVSLTALGNQTPAQLVSQIGTNGKIRLKYGDIVKVYAKEGQHALYVSDNGPTQPLAGLRNEDTLFLLVTKEGFIPIYLNQLTPKEVSIVSESTATTALYDAHYNSIANYFTVNGDGSLYTSIKPNGFETYPKLNLAVDEKADGRVRVTEPTSGTSDQYITYAYDTTFVGSGPEMQIVSPLSALSFGSQTIKSQRQEIKRTDPNWGFTVLDSRQTKAAWVIQAKITGPFKTSGANPQELKGAELRVKQASSTVSLNEGYQTIYTKDNPTASNAITWAAKEGFFLEVPPGVMTKDASYATDVEFILTNAP